jgi:hypothetical protein
MQFDLLVRTPVPNLHSLSGIEILDGDIYVIGDDSPSLIKLDDDFNVLEKFALVPELVSLEKIPKKDKPDLEAMCTVNLGENELLFIFGSGSKSPQRDVLFIFNPQQPSVITKKSLEEFYAHLKKSFHLSDTDLNIEAAVYFDQEFFLFNRGNNVIYQFSIVDLYTYFEKPQQIPNFRSYQLKLPSINNHLARFTGATVHEEKIIFTASIENTTNWIDDGPVLGSFIGTIPVSALNDNYQPECILIAENGTILPIKVESIAIINSSENELEIFLVTDTDGGVSEIISAKISV